ncbi:MAG TPA: methyl-accepting chemotaxis protein, partial [Opitutus sp.]|nr:methyl-accepting chemotaxis protein [Opitutus sp.]
MKTWSLRKLLLVGFSVPTLAILALAATCFVSLGTVRHEVTQITGESIPGLTISNRALGEATAYRVTTLKHIISDNVDEMKALDEQCIALGKQVLATLATYQQKIVTPEDRALFERVGPAFETYRESARAIRELSLAGKPAEAEVLMKGSGSQAFAAYEQTVQALVNYNITAAETSRTQVAATMVRASYVTTVVSLSAIALCVLAGFLITRFVNKTLRRVSAALDDTSAQVTSAASQVSGASQSLAEGASEQAASLEETGASIEELSSMTKRNADSAQQTKELSNHTRSAADTCATDMQEMNRAMDEIKASSSDISKIIKTIDEIAFQTNILALNAAVEAARAGEAGMGFAVVADEVRSLAQRSAQSAKETASKIEEAIGKSEQGVRISGKVAASLGEIVEKARRVDALVAEIATASQEQSQGIQQVNTTVSQMDKVTQSTASNAEET